MDRPNRPPSKRLGRVGRSVGKSGKCGASDFHTHHLNIITPHPTGG